MKTEKTKKAARYSAAAHKRQGQVRKYSGRPYIVHPAAVAKIVQSVAHDEDMVCASWLHDTVEDTDVTIDDIRKEFGDNVAEMVSDLTDVSVPSDGNRKTRKMIDRAHTSKALPASKTIKLADLIHNTGDIVSNDVNFGRVYLREKKLLLEVLGDGDPKLHALATDMLKKSMKILDME